MEQMQDNSEFKQDISAIEEKRQVLERIVDITQTIESMQKSLNSALMLGLSSKEMPEDAYTLYSALSDSIRNLPVIKIKEYLANMETIIKSQLEKILGFSGVEFDSDDTVESVYLAGDGVDENPLNLLEDFKRTAQTAVSLKVLLKNRGVQTDGSDLPVPRDTIHKQLKHLDAQEKQQRTKAKEKIGEMREDLDKMIDNPSYPAEMKEMLKAVQGNLDQDLKHIDAGVSLGKLSFVAEAAEVTAIEEVTVETEEIEITAIPEPQDVGFSTAASRWLNTPWDTSWDDVRKGQ